MSGNWEDAAPAGIANATTAMVEAMTSRRFMSGSSRWGLNAFPATGWTETWSSALSTFLHVVLLGT
jgi:hypothetical protein